MPTIERFVVGCLLVTGAVLNHFDLLMSPLNYSLNLQQFSETNSSTACINHLQYRQCHSGHSNHNDHHQKRFCSCGKCTLVELFQQCCPLSHRATLTPLSNLIVMTSYYTSDFLVNGTVGQLPSVDGLLNSTLSLELRSFPTPLQDTPACDRVVNQCGFRYKRARVYYSVQQYYGSCIMDLFHVNNPLSVNTDKETLKLSLYLRTLMHNHFIMQPLRPFQVMIKVRHYLTPKNIYNCKLIEDSRNTAHFAFLLLLLAGDVELNPGPGKSTSIEYNSSSGQFVNSIL